MLAPLQRRAVQRSAVYNIDRRSAAYNNVRAAQTNVLLQGKRTNPEWRYGNFRSSRLLSTFDLFLRLAHLGLLLLEELCVSASLFESLGLSRHYYCCTLVKDGEE